MEREKKENNIPEVFNKISKVNYSKGFNRTYFVMTVLWLIFANTTLIISVIGDNINMYTEEGGLSFMILRLFSILIFPFVLYVILFFLFKILLWIMKGFGDNLITTQKTNKKYWGDENLFFLVDKNKYLFYGLWAIILFLNVLMITIFTEYSTYEDKIESIRERHELMENTPNPFEGRRFRLE